MRHTLNLNHNDHPNKEILYSALNDQLLAKKTPIIYQGEINYEQGATMKHITIKTIEGETILLPENNIDYIKATSDRECEIFLRSGSSFSTAMSLTRISVLMEHKSNPRKITKINSPL